MAEVVMDVLRAQVVRHSVNQNWGFHLEGGVDYGNPIQILRVTPASPADKIGVQPGDLVTEIGDIPTEGLTLDQAKDIVADFGETILLTLERRARGAVPQNPVLAHKTVDGQDAIKQYQPLNMSGGTGGRKFHVVQSQPFHDAGPRVIPTPAQSGVQLIATPPPTSPQEKYQQPAAQPSYQTQYYDEDPRSGTQSPQSRTFQTIQNVLSYDVPSAGSSGLPPPRSVYMDRFREQQAAQRGGAESPRVRVLRAQQYNNPMGLYSAPNVMDTFQTQTSALLDEINKEPVAPTGQDPYRVTNTIQFSTNAHSDSGSDVPKPQPYTAPSSQFMLPSQHAARSPYSRVSPNRNIQQSTQAFSNLKINAADPSGSYMSSSKTVEESSTVKYGPPGQYIEESLPLASDSRSYNVKSSRRVEKTSVVQYGEPSQIQPVSFGQPVQSVGYESVDQHAYTGQPVQNLQHVQPVSYAQPQPVSYAPPSQPHAQPVEHFKSQQDSSWKSSTGTHHFQEQHSQTTLKHEPTQYVQPSQFTPGVSHAEQQAVRQIQVQHTQESRNVESMQPMHQVHIQPGQSVHIKQTSSSQRIEVKSVPNVDLPASMIAANASGTESTPSFAGATGLRPVPTSVSKKAGDDGEIKIYFTSVTVGSRNRIKQKQEQIFRVLDAKKIPYRKIDIATNSDLKDEMRAIANNPTELPPVFVKGSRYLGGFDEFEYAVEMEDIPSFFN